MKILQILIRNREYRILFAIIILAIFLRFYNLLSVPPSASLDEVSIGYNAYSILNTGADEYGTKFPILLRSYDDFRPALYVYLVIPFVKIFGLSAFSVRLPSVILSIFTIFSTYFLVKELFKRWDIAILTSFLLTISPWHTYISRLGHEVNAGLSFFVFGLTFFLRRQLFFGILFFALSLISYQSEKIFLPVFLIGLCILFRKEIILQKKQFLLGCFISCLILIPFVKASLQPNALIRFNATNIFTANGQRFEKQAVLLARAVEDKNPLGEIIYNRRVVAAQILLENYISHFNPVWLFTNLGNDRHKVPNIGLMYLWEAPFLLIGLIMVLLQKFDRRIKLLLGLWLLISPLPGALTTDAPHALRTYQIIPLPQILTAIGLIGFISYIRAKYVQLSIIFICITFNFLFFFHNYFIIFPKTQSSSFQYALSKAIPYVLENEKTYNKIIFSNKDNLYQSYMFFLFYSKYDPFLYQKEGGTQSGGYDKTHSFGKYQFRPLIQQPEEKSTIYIGNIYEISRKLNVISIFRNLDERDSIIVSK